MTTVVISPTSVLSFPEGGGHWWVYLQYVLGLRDLGCSVWWLERLAPGPDRPSTEVSVGLRQLEAFGLGGRILAYEGDGRDGDRRWVVSDEAAFDRLTRSADLLLNFDYRADASVVGRFRRSALVDIDPGLLQHWLANDQLHAARHDHWFTIGETVGTERARFPDAGLPWRHIRPVLHLPSWPRADDSPEQPYTSVTSWWGDEWFTDGRGELFENNKRVTFLEHAELPRRSGVDLELAAYFGDSRRASSGPELRPEDAAGDSEDVRRMLAGGWRLRRSAEVAADPWSYRAYVQRSRGEFSCVKPSCIALQNAWVSDRTLCYLASGRPVVVQDTGPSDLLPQRLGMLRFSSPDDALACLREVEAAYDRHAAAARELAHEFDSGLVLPALLDTALGPAASPPAPQEAGSS